MRISPIGGPGYAERLLDPLISLNADMAIGYPYRTDQFWDRFDPFSIQRWIAGERAVWSVDLAPLLPAMRTSRFGVETLVNMHYKACHRRVCLIALEGLFHPIKFEKTPGMTAWREYLRETLEILRTHVVHPLYTFMTTVPDLLDLRDAAVAVARALRGRAESASDREA